MSEYIGIKELGERLGVKKATVYSWVHKQEIPYYKFCRLVKFKTHEIEKWVLSKRVEVVKYD